MVTEAPGIWLLDNSAWQRGLTDSVAREVRSELATLLDAGCLAVCPPFLLEAGYSARNGQKHTELMALFGSLERFELTEASTVRAVSCQSQLATVGHHRIPPVDLMIAAIADVEGIGVIHYDADYDLILEHSDLRFESRWLGPRGSI